LVLGPSLALLGSIATAVVQATSIAVLSAAFVALTAVASAANAGTETVLYAFRGFPAGDGANPHAAPIMDDKGNLYGTASAGGGGGCGVVYKLHRTRSGTWKETILYSFACGDDGNGPLGGLVRDNRGNLYGGTELGGTGECVFFGGRVGCGVVYKLTPGKGGIWTETVLYSFPAPQQGSEFGGPLASLTYDGKDTLYGTTVLDDACGGSNHGSVFRLKLVNGIWKEHDIHDFCGNDGSAPGYGALVPDAAGNLYGTTMTGGSDTGQGVVFELSPLDRDKWQFTKLHEFTEEEGGTLEGGLTIGASGNLYGAEFAGGLSNHGAVYELSPAGGAWNLDVLYEFVGGGLDGNGPWASPVFDSGGNLFGTTQGGGTAAFCQNCGVIYKLVPQGGGQWSESVVYSFGSQENIADGADPVAGLVRAADGNFYGTTYEGGDKSCNCGVVFEYTP
jgi:uncharacterized repeat protein (TIGR03803 family)